MGKIQGKVTKVVTKQFPVTGEDGKSTIMVDYKITVQSEEGETVTVSKYAPKTSHFELPEGTEVLVNYDTKPGKYGPQHKVIQKGLVLLNQAKSTATTGQTTSSEGKTEHKTSKSSSSTAPAVDWAAKDLSMEVSGLLQAIITHHGLDSSTENKLRTALTLKRTVALDYSGGNTPSVSLSSSKSESKTTTATKKVSKPVEVLEEEPEEEDDTPFDMN